MRSKMNTSIVEENISPIWLDYLSHIMINTLGQPFQLFFAPYTTERTKSILRKANSLQDRPARSQANAAWVLKQKLGQCCP